MSDYLKSNWVLISSFLFIMANSALIAMEQYWFALLPFALVVLLLAFVAADKLMWVIVFTTPLSLNLEELELGGVGMFLPTEPLLFGLMLIFFLKLLYEKRFDSKVLRHPLTISIYIYIAWLIVTMLTSSMFVVSLKFILAKMWYIVAVYFVASQFFKNQKNILTFFWVYLIPLSGVAIYTFLHHSTYGFAERPAHWVMQPFFKDHTVYGAVLALMFPIMICLFVLERYKKYRLITFLMIITLSLGIIFSYGRAAWVSLVVAFLVSFIYIFKMRGSFVLSIAGLVLIFTAIFWNNIIDVLEENKQDSTSENLAEHVQSISNISTDASNLERINRWKSAYRMFEARPIFGWGPGTYMFQYAPFQASEDLTIISTNSADGGNAHSEFLGPLSESGFIGTLTFLLIVIVFYRTASRLYWTLPKGELRTIVFFVILAFTTYMVNGTLNNFLDTDKASIPFWGLIAIIMSIDLHYKEMLKRENQQLKS